ncbi:MAG: LAGLIDADG family homing endonuclease [Candidatus Aenigmatarchaeota archaeon]
MLNVTKVDTYENLLQNKNVYVAVQKEFIREIRCKIKTRYGTLSKYNKINLGLKSCTFRYMFKKYARTIQFSRLVKMSGDCGIPKEVVFSKITGFRASGSHRKNNIKLPRYIPINENFIEGYALYLAEGDTGLSGKTKPRKLRFTNSEISVINHFIGWIRKYFRDLDFYVNVIVPNSVVLKNYEKCIISQKLNASEKQIKFSSGNYNKKLKYRVCVDRAIIIDLFLSIEKIIKEISFINTTYASAYIRGMMIGEGTVYSNNYFYVRLEMRNEREVKFISNLLNNLGIKHTINERNKRHGMWSVFIGRKDSVLKFHQIIGFGVHRKRQAILDGIIDSISVNPDVAVTTRLLIAKAEKHIA